MEDAWRPLGVGFEPLGQWLCFPYSSCVPCFGHVLKLGSRIVNWYPQHGSASCRRSFTLSNKAGKCLWSKNITIVKWFLCVPLLDDKYFNVLSCFICKSNKSFSYSEDGDDC